MEGESCPYVYIRVYQCCQDEVALELNKAVLHSYKMAGVSMVDHFTQADQVNII